MEEFSEPDRPAYRILTRDHYDAMRHCKCGGRYAITASRSGDAAGDVADPDSPLRGAAGPRAVPVFDVHDGECPGCGRRIRYVIDVAFYVRQLGGLLAKLHAETDAADAQADA